MVLSSVALYRYELPLTTPLQLGGERWDCRRGVLLRLETDEGAIGWGEAAPLPGFSAESLEAVVSHLRATVPPWVGPTMPTAEPDLERAWDALPPGPDAPPSVRFATESAIVELLAAANETSVPAVLGMPRSTVALNALVTDLVNEGPAQATRCREQGYRAVKAKVGRGAMEQEVDALRRIRDVLGESVALRADANRAWSFDEAVHFAEATRDLNLAYVEEPLTDPSQRSDLTAQTDLPVALDETTREVGPEVLREKGDVAAVVLKPTLLGLRTVRTWSRAATAHDATPVLSAAYESGVGLRMLVAMAAVGPDVPVGLSTYARLAADVLQSPLSLHGPTVDVSSVVNTSPTVDEDLLTHIDTFSE